MTTAAQEEFNDLVAKNTHRETLHPEDRNDPEFHDKDDHLTEEDSFRNAQIDAAMRTNTLMGGGASPDVNLPPTSFDSGHSTGVKGVIADARSFEAARRSKWKSRIQNARQSIFGLDSVPRAQRSGSANSDSGSLSSSPSESGGGPDEEAFLEEWRERRRKELEAEAARSHRTRRTSPSARTYGRLDTVDAMGYLDAIEKVGRETRVLVFVYDHECEVSASVESAILPLVKAHPTIHFVKVHYDDIEFDPAAVPSLLAYRNQGDLFANMTGLIEMIPDEETFGPAALTKILQQHNVL